MNRMKKVLALVLVLALLLALAACSKEDKKGDSGKTTTTQKPTTTTTTTTTTGDELLPEEERDGSKELPFEIGGALEFDAVVKAGGVTYYDVYRVDGTILTLESADATIEYEGKTYEPQNGVISIPVSTPDMFAPIKLAIGNRGGADATFKVTFAYPSGTKLNPILLEEGELVTVLKDGDEDGLVYLYTATEAGTFTIVDKSVTKGDGYDISLLNLTTFAGRTLEEDGVVKEGLKMVSVEVSKGDQVEVTIAALPNDKNEFPAVTLKTQVVLARVRAPTRRIYNKKSPTESSVGDFSYLFLFAQGFLNSVFQLFVGDRVGEHVGDHTVFIDDAGAGIGVVDAAQHGVIAGALHFGGVATGDKVADKHDGGVGIVLRDIGGGGLGQHAVYRYHHDVVAVFLRHRVKVGQLCHAGATGGVPEVDDSDLVGLGGIQGFLLYARGGDDRQIIAVAQRAHGVAAVGGQVVYLHLGGGYIPVIDAGANQNGQQCYGGDDAGDQLFLFLGLNHLGGVVLGDDVLGQQDLGSLPLDSLGGADGDTLAAADALGVTHVANVHLAVGDTAVTVHALVAVELDAEDGEAIKQGVQRTQRADETAEQTEDKDATHQNADHQ